MGPMGPERADHGAEVEDRGERAPAASRVVGWPPPPRSRSPGARRGLHRKRSVIRHVSVKNPWNGEACRPVGWASSLSGSQHPCLILGIAIRPRSKGTRLHAWPRHICRPGHALGKRQAGSLSHGGAGRRLVIGSGMAHGLLASADAVTDHRIVSVPDHPWSRRPCCAPQVADRLDSDLRGRIRLL